MGESIKPRHTSPSGVLTQIQITSDVSDLPIGFSTQLNAVAYYSDGQTKIITYTSLWNSSEPEYATVDKGWVISKASGPVEITAEYQGLSASFMLNITDASVVSMIVDPVYSNVALGEHVQYRVMGTFSDQSIIDISLATNLTWTSIAESVATIDQTTAIAQTHGVGSTSINAIANGVHSNTVNLNVSSKVITTTWLTPESATLPVGLIQQFTATATYSDGSKSDVTNSALNWKSSNFNNLLSLGAGAFRGEREGYAYVSNEGSTNSPRVLVENIQPKQLVIRIKTNTEANISLNEPVHLSVSVVFEDESEFDISPLRQVYWQSSDLSIAAVTLDGKVFPRKPGVVKITATSKHFNNISVTKQFVID